MITTFFSIHMTENILSLKSIIDSISVWETNVGQPSMSHARKRMAHDITKRWTIQMTQLWIEIAL